MVTSEPPVSENEKREALAAVLSSTTFARSAQLRAFLRHICEMEIAGQTAQLNEYEIAVEVLGRRKDVDLTDDSSVRNRAYELRQRLDKFYATEQPLAKLRIEIPRGGYVPAFVRHSPDVPAVMMPEVVLSPAVEPVAAARGRISTLALVVAGVGLLGVAIGWLAGTAGQKPRMPAVLEESWGPLAEPGGDLLISIATNLHLLIRPHIPSRPGRMDVPRELYPRFGTTRPLGESEILYMEPAQLSIPLGELAAAATLASTRTSFGGGYQILPESEAPLPALLGRNGALFGTPVNSKAATVLLKTLPLSIGFTAKDEFAIIDQRKAPGSNILYTPSGSDPSTQYGLLTVLTGMDSAGKTRRTLELTGTGTSSALQGAVEFFCSAASMRELRARMGGFPPNYQVVVRCTVSGLRLISYHYEAHVIVDKPLDVGN